MVVKSGKMEGTDIPHKCSMPNLSRHKADSSFPKGALDALAWLSLWESTKGTSFASLSPQVTERAQKNSHQKVAVFTL